MKKKRMLVIYASAGGGHYSAAKAVEKAMNERYPAYEIILLDGPKLTGSKLINFFTDIYDVFLKTNTKYAIWGFWILNASKGDKTLVNFFPGIVKRAAKYFAEVNPDIILSVNSGVNAFVTEIYKELGWEEKVPFIICCTDPTNGFVKGWSHPEVDLMVAPLEECKTQLMEYGMPENKIRVLNGVPVNPSFSRDTKSKQEARNSLNLDADRFTVLATSGGVGTRDLSAIVKELALSNLDLQIIVCCGKNEGQVKELEKFARSVDKTIKVIGYTDKMFTLMDAADIIVGKPGPGVIAEAAVKQRPLILECLNGILHQEKGNLQYALEKGIALQADTKNQVIEKVRFLMENQGKYAEMVLNMSRITNADAVYHLVDLIIDYANGEFINARSKSFNQQINKFPKENPGYLYNTSPLIADT